LQLAVLGAAVACGAHVANYVPALWPLHEQGTIRGAHARDALTGNGLDILARVVINAAGPGIEAWLDRPSPTPSPLFRASKAFNLLVRELPFRDALGLTAFRGTYFIIPWNGYSLVGTRHLSCDHRERSADISRDEVLDFLADLNPFLGQYRLKAQDVCGVFSGLLPEAAGGRGPDVELERMPQVIHHGDQGLRGLFSIIGVKWTTARAVGEEVAKLVCRRLDRSIAAIRERSLDTSIRIPSRETDPTLGARVVPDQPVLFAHVLHAVREEMAVRLWDVVRRRTPLYLSQALDRSALKACATVMARELRWTQPRISAEIEAAEAELNAFRGPLRAALRVRSSLKRGESEISYASPR
jgi:glycerol-3-phosphate dehydrogenase